VARDSFWELLIDLSRNQGVTIFVTTHFMNEGLRCDRISLMNSGRVLACDAPTKLIEERGAASLEDAFISYMEQGLKEMEAQRAAEAAADAAKAGGPKAAIAGAATSAKSVSAGTAGAAAAAKDPPRPRKPRAEARRETSRCAHQALRRDTAPARGTLVPLPLRRLWAYSKNETVQILRDPVRLAFAFVGSALLMLIFGFGSPRTSSTSATASWTATRPPRAGPYIEQFRSTPQYFRSTPRCSRTTRA
jgi:ribosome-dependent ATPase